MKLQLFSDLHIETIPSAHFSLPVMDSDVIILAGDIHIGLYGIDWAAEIVETHQKPVIYVAGNHEYYRREYFNLTQELRDFSVQVDNLYFLEKECIELNGVRFLGTTLWTNYRAEFGVDEFNKFKQSASRISDHQLIKYRDHLFTPEDAFELNQESVEWLESEIDKPYIGKTVVVTHHGPSNSCIHPYYGFDDLTTAFLSDFDELVKKADVWCYGHTHANLDTNVGKCRLVSNQKGYPHERMPSAFRPELVVEL